MHHNASWYAIMHENEILSLSLSLPLPSLSSSSGEVFFISPRPLNAIPRPAILHHREVIAFGGSAPLIIDHAVVATDRRRWGQSEKCSRGSRTSYALSRRRLRPLFASLKKSPMDNSERRFSTAS